MIPSIAFEGGAALLRLLDDAFDGHLATVVDDGPVAGAAQGGSSAHGDGETSGFARDAGVAAAGDE